MPISKTTSGNVAGTSVGRNYQTSRTTDAKKRNVNTVTTRGNEKKQSVTTSRQHTSKKGNVSEKSKTKQQETERAGVNKDMKITLAEKTTNLVEVGNKEVRSDKKDLGGGVTADAYYQGPSFKMDGEASLTRKGFGVDIDVKLKIDANLFKAGASAEKEFKFRVNGEDVSVKVNLGAEGQVGINGELKLKIHVGKDGVSVSAGAEGFAGAKGTLSGGLSVSVNGRESAKGEIKVTAAAGAMAGAEFEAGLTHFKAKAYAAVGVGVGIEISGNVNAGNVVRSAGGLALPGHQGW